MNSQIVVKPESRQGQEKILGFPQGKFESLGIFLGGCAMEGESDVKRLLHQRDRWNFKHYWALRDNDEDGELLARAMCKEIDKMIDEVSKLHYGVST